MPEGRGSVFGGILLIGGSCIGAGMLGLPILTGLCGFGPSLLLLFCGWLFMTSTALLLVEVGGRFARPVHLLSMAQSSLGRWGKAVCWITYLFLFYALLVAYISGIGGLSTTIFRSPPWAGSLLFVLLFGWIIYFGTRKVDLFNRLLMVGKVGFFLLLVLVGAFYVNPELLIRADPSYMTAALPLLVISFGFHNMIPSLTSYLKGDLKRIRRTIIGGSLFVLAIYVIWEIIVLGIIPLEGENGLLMSLTQDREASQSIAALLNSSTMRLFAQGLAFFALLTSFLAQALSLVHFLADGFKISYKKQESLSLCLLALMPPLVLSLIYPQLFFKALNFAGGFCAVILFGFLPVAMAWVSRKKKASPSDYRLMGGKLSLIAILIFALFIFGVQWAGLVF